MKLRNISNRPVVLHDISGVLYEVPAYNEIDVNSALWADNEFRRTLRYRIRDIVVSDDVATALPTVVNAPNAAATPLVLAGTTSQTGDLLQLKNVGGTVLSKFSAAGILTAPSISLAAGSAGTEPITIQAVSGQTANLQSWRDQANVQLVAITSSGQLKLGSDVTLIRGAANTLEVGQKTLLNQSAGGPVALAVKAAADANEKFSVLSTTGSVNFGSGSGATDTVLQRAAANVLETTGDFRVGNGIIVSQGTVSPTTAALGLRFGSGLDTNLYRSAANELKTDDSVVVALNLTVSGTGAFTGVVTGPTAAGGTSTTQLATTAFVQNAVSAISGGSGGIAFLGNAQTFTAIDTFEAGAVGTVTTQHRVTADGTPRLAIFADGKHEWGPGNAARDTNLYRVQADRLKTDDEFEVGAQLRLTTTGVRFNDGTTFTSSTHAAQHHPQTGSDRIVMSLTSVVASRPAATAVVDGTLHYASDEGVVYRSNGTTWSKAAVRDYPDLDNLPGTDAAAGTGSLRTLGTGATQAAAGSHAAQHSRTGADPLSITTFMGSGTLASRPSSSLVAGMRYFATDQLVDYMYDGAAWIRMSLPAGAFMLWGSASIPTGWVVYDGSSLPASTGIYADIYAHFGSTLTKPDWKGRVPSGFDSAQTEFDALGETGGAKTHTLVIGEIPSHTHGLPGYVLETFGTATGYGGGGGDGLPNGTATLANGGGGAHNNLQPYKVAHYIGKL